MMRRAGSTSLGLLLLMLGPACLASAAPGLRVVPIAALASREAFDTILTTAVASGDQSLVVPVPLFEDSPAMLLDMVSTARARGLRVVAAVDVTRVASANEWPASRDHVIYTHPEWLMVPRELSLELARVYVQCPDYAGARANAQTQTGLYLSAYRGGCLRGWRGAASDRACPVRWRPVRHGAISIRRFRLQPVDTAGTSRGAGFSSAALPQR